MQMNTYRSRRTANSPAEATSPTDAFGTITEVLHGIDGFAEHYLVKTLTGPEPALLVCRRSDGEPIDHGWVKRDPVTGRLFRDYPVGGWTTGPKGSARHLFRDVADAGNYLRFIVANHNR